MNLKEIVASCIVGLLALVLIIHGVGHNLDKPQPVRGANGTITHFDTPEGVIEKGTPRFEELVASYEQK